METKAQQDLLDEPVEEELFVSEYDISSNPNDFNVATLKSYIESDAIIIPSFQRNYVWDIKRASRFIESLILGLPIPQLFLYEESKNKYLVIDGQQRLMTIYYFLLGRFPKKNKRSEVRRIFDEQGAIPNELLHNNELFQDFKLDLPSTDSGSKNPLNRLDYQSLDEQRTTLDLRTIRCVMIKQNAPKNDDSSVYEIFNRLNTGGTNLKAQEIRACMYRSPFYGMLAKINSDERWRRFFGKPELDLHMRDIEILLRSFAMLASGQRYTTTMSKFLNTFSRQQMSASSSEVKYLESLFQSFLDQSDDWTDDIFLNKRGNGKFNVNLFEAVFVMSAFPAFSTNTLKVQAPDQAKIDTLANDASFIEASSARTTNSSNVRKRLETAAHIFHIDWPQP